ncbi:MAG: hypothetical protein JWQ42_4668 [Edaphobacter sp.]|nr:hypothetical protein [Edaphobacter sp.]
MENLQSRLDSAGVWSSVLRSSAAKGYLETIQLMDDLDPNPPDKKEGTAKLGAVESLGSLKLDLIAPNDERPYVLTLTGPPKSRTAFRFALSLNDGPQKAVFNLVQSLPGHLLTAATKHPSGGDPPEDAEWLEATPGAPPVVLTGANVWLVIRGKANGSVEVLLSPNKDAPDDVIVLGLEPSTVLLGTTGFGLELTSGVAFDDADDAVPPDKTMIDGAVIDTPADQPPWRGIAVRTARFFLPKGVPFLGGHAVDAHLQIGRAPTPGIDLLILAKVPANGNRPGIDVRIECRDPTATGLDGFVPTLVEAVMELPTPGHTEAAAPGGALTLGGGKPVRVRARFARKPGGPGIPPSIDLSLAVESQGPDGLVKIDSAVGGLGAKIAVTAATVATALVANGGGPALHTLLTAAVGLSSFLDAGQLVMHRAEILTSGTSAPVGGPVKLKIDYSVAAVVTGIDVEVLAVNMNPNQPLRVRVREVVLTIDTAQSGLDMISLDYTKSSLEVEDPGGWKVKGLDNLFDVLGTRSGRGSFWIEVDLRFKLNLGPVKVNGATIRATIDQDSGKVTGSLRGLDASIALDPLIDGDGAVQLTEKGFRAALAATVVPLDLSASADVETDGDMIKLDLGVDFPGPIPLANTGLGIYGFGGLFVANGRPAPVPPGDDAIKFQLDWDYRKAGSFVPSPDFSFGLEAVIGTAPDMGFTFSARAGIFLTTPDIVIRGSMKGVMMAPRVKITRDEPIVKVLEAKGVVVIDPADAVTIAIDGVYEIPHIVITHVPVAARFPKGSPDWFIHLGSDGWTPPLGRPSEGRESGPISSTMFPELLGQSSDAYIMFRGNGITEWPRGGQDSGGVKISCDPGTFVSAFGFGFNAVWGLKPIVWAELFARADVLFSTQPTTLAAMGCVGGDIHVGFFSIGVDATVFVMLMDGQEPYLQAEVCGTIDLFFHEIHKCVKISYNSEPSPTLPQPPNPLDGPQSLTNDKYEVIAPLFGRREEATEINSVWPDAIPLLTFATAPELAGGYAQFPSANVYPTKFRAKPMGGDALEYDWELNGLKLFDATDPANEKLVPGTMSATWLIGKFGDAGGQAQPAELALLTPDPGLWFAALPDAGKSLPGDPLTTQANLCQAKAVARLGWAPGALASVSGDGWSLPPDPLSVDALQSQVRVQIELRWLPGGRTNGFVLDHLSVQLIPARVGYAVPRVVSLASSADFDGRNFTGFLDVGGTLLPPGLPIQDLPQKFAGPAQLLNVTFAEPLRQARIWLAIPRKEWAPGRFRTVDNNAAAWSPDKVVNFDADRFAVRFAAVGAAEATTLAITYPIGMPLGVIGVAGITHTAALAADARNAATKAQADLLDKAAKDKPPQFDSPSSSTVRCMLKPGSVYRIEVAMRWSGKLSKRDDMGKPLTIAEHKLEDDPPIMRSFWFRTAKAEALSRPGTVEFFTEIHRRRDLFHPEMLERYLLGYEPAQSELFRFADDPARVYFRVSHVGALAGAYGFELCCGLRRLDAPKEVEPDQVLRSVLEWASTSNLLTGSQKAKADAYAASVCKQPPPNVVMEVPMKLSRLSWYEVFVLAKSTKGELDGRLPGVSFRTSRWATGAEMLNTLHFRKVVSGRSTGTATGGAVLRADAVLTPTRVEGDDAAFDAFIDHVGLDGWPVATEPRISLLWRQQAATWSCAGVLIESPEPIHRPGRFTVDSLTLIMGAAGKGVVFDISLRDRSGSRLLFATSKPFVPVRNVGSRNPPLMQLNCHDLGPVPATLGGSLTVPLQPSFAEEAL